MTPFDPYIGRRMRPSLLMRVLLRLTGRSVRHWRPRTPRLPRHERLGNHLRRDIGLQPIRDWERWS
jgi:hypothetical protein